MLSSGETEVDGMTYCFQSGKQAGRALDIALNLCWSIRYFLYAKTRIGYRMHQRDLRNRSLTPHTVVHSTILGGRCNEIRF